MPRHRRFTTHPGSTADSPEEFPLGPFAAALAGAAEFRFPPSPPRRTWHLQWPAALLLHVAIIALALISFPPQMSLEPESQSQVSIVEDTPGASQATAPLAQTQGPPKLAQVPPSPSAAPPPQAAPQTPETNLDIPQDLFSQFILPPAAPQSQPQQVQNTRPVHRTRPVQHPYQVMNDMSFGNQSTGAPAPLMPNARHGLNLQLSQSDLNAMNKPEITVQGEIGSDWMSGFNKWVDAHIYYPQAAIENNQQGTSTIEFTVHRDGRVTGVHLLGSAGSPFLDQAWLGIFLQNNVPPFPPGTKSDTIKITASLEYQLIH